MVRWLAARRRRWQHPLLARSQARASDAEIDAALRTAGLTRAELFTPQNAIAAHRTRMAHMLAAFEIDVAQATAERWGTFKTADGLCARCTQTGRCQRWLEWGQRNEAPWVFCPNAATFAAIAAEQARAMLARQTVG